MFIRPIDVALLPAAGAVWQDHAGNTHFVLQSKKKDGGNVMRSLFSGLSMGLGLAQQQPPQPSAPVPSATSASASGGAAATSATGTTSAAGGIAASVAAGTSSTVDAAYRRSLLEFDFRILLRFVSRKQVFVVAVDDAFDKIHTDWNWVERNLFLKLAEIDAASLSAKPHTTPDQIDNQLLRQFEEMTEEYADPQAAGAKAKLLDIKNQLALVFPSANEDVLLNFYPCTYWVTDVISARGQLCIGRNTVYFFGTRQPGQADQDTSVPTSVAILFPYRQISVLELVTAKRALIPDSIQVGVKDKTYTFVLYFHRKEVYRILVSLCDAAMNRLIKGAENSLSASHEMFSKNSSNMTGDLAIASVNKGGGLLMGRSREVFGLDGGHRATMDRNMSLGVSGMDVGDSDLGDAIGEQDFTDQAAVESPVSIKLQTPHGSARGKDPHSAQNATIPAPHAAPVRDTVASASSSNTVVRYSHIKTALVNSLTDLDNQNRNLEFRNLFRLSYHETITMEESPCYYFHKPSSTSYTGNLYLSQNFATYAAQFPASSSSATAAAAASAAATGSSVSISMLFDNAQDPNLVFVIPYSHIVSIKKQPATALPLSGKLSSFSLSGYLVISSKNRGEFWLAFSAAKSRDRVSDILLSRIRTVDWRFDDDVVIGGRNGMTVAGGPGASVAASPLSSPIYGDAPAATRSGSVSSLYSGAAASPAISSSTYMSTYSYDGSAASNSTSGAVGGNGSNAGGRIQTLRTGLKFIMPQTERNGRPTIAKEDDPASIARWSDYFDANGRDVCIVKDMRALRDLLLRTDGVPERFRGDFWMLVSGAWYSKPETGYYEQLLLANQHRANPFAEEIEKDLHRSLPEHPAYQSPVGIDALRRLLTAFSWRNPAIGYAQALNIISAVLLLHLREDDAFWMLCMIVERMLPDHYTKTLVGSVVDQSVFKQLVRVHLPTLDAHLEKLYMDLSTFSVPWFLCLYLNSVSFKVAIKLLDYFFLDGPKFLFWMAVGVLKVNEGKLITKGKDDDIFVAILKDFFTRLGLPDSGLDSPVVGATPSDSTPSGAPLAPASASGSGGGGHDGGVGHGSDISTMTGRPLYEHLIMTACTVLGPQITTETIDTLRMRYRLKVVHQMEDTNRKSQVRTLCEQVTLSFDEVSSVYDQVRQLEFVHGEEEEDPNGHAARLTDEGRLEEDGMRATLASLGGWGLVSRYQRQTRVARPRALSAANGISGGGGSSLLGSPLAPVPASQDTTHKSISLYDFRKVFGMVSPWRGTPASDHTATMRRKTTMAGRSDGTGTGTSIGADGSLAPPSIDISTSTAAEDLHLTLVDRVYFYCSFQFNFVQRQKRGQAESAAAARLFAMGGTSGTAPASTLSGTGGPSSEASEPGYVVDLAAMVHVLDAVMKQPLHSRLRFLFDLHDLDGDGVLNKIELKAVMDSFLEMFEKSRVVQGRSDDGRSADAGSGRDGAKDGAQLRVEDEEVYLRAVSSFLNAALQMGNNKSGDAAGGAGSSSGTGVSGPSAAASGSAASRKRAASSASTRPASGADVPGSVSGSGGQGIRASKSTAQALLEGGDLGTQVDDDLGGDLGSAGASDGLRLASVVDGAAALSLADASSSPSVRGGVSSKQSAPAAGGGSSRKPKDAETDAPFRLSFNEFLLAVLSQSTFVQYFERTWSIRKEPSGTIVVVWQSKA